MQLRRLHVGETGTCALERDPLRASTGWATRWIPAQTTWPLMRMAARLTPPASAPHLEQQARTSSFPSSRTLGPDVISEMMASRYVTVVGILAIPSPGRRMPSSST